MKKLRPRFQALTNTLSCTFVLMLMGLATLGILATRNIKQQLNENLIVTLVLGGNDEELWDAEEEMGTPITETIKSLESERFVKNVQLITAEEILTEQATTIGRNPVDFLGFNPFYNELELTIRSEYVNSDSMKTVTEEIARKYPLASEINYEKDLVDNLSQTIQKITFILMLLAGLFLIILITLINNMVHLSIYARRFHIYTMKLVGASWGFIRRPFIRRSLTIGFVAGILADMVLLACIKWLLDYDPTLALFVTTRDILLMTLTLLLSGLLLPLCCTYISVNHFIRMKERKLHE